MSLPTIPDGWCNWPHGVLKAPPLSEISDCTISPHCPAPSCFNWPPTRHEWLCNTEPVLRNEWTRNFWKGGFFYYGWVIKLIHTAFPTFSLPFHKTHFPRAFLEPVSCVCCVCCVCSPSPLTGRFTFVGLRHYGRRIQENFKIHSK